MRVLVTGGCGFIGSHQTVALLAAGHHVTIVDNLSNASVRVLDAIEQITGQRPDFHKINVADTAALYEIMRQSSTEAVIHFAASKHVPESFSRCLDYYENNVGGLLSLLRACEHASVYKIVFSSSGSVYGETETLPIKESHRHAPSNPYSSSKSMAEKILSDLCDNDQRWSVAALRYFNPAGAHHSGLIGEDPTGLLSNLLPVLMHVAVGNKESVSIFGEDFNTPDGSGVRDYVHVEDVAEAHLRALKLLDSPAHKKKGFVAMNIGRGEGVSVKEMIAAVEHATGAPIKTEVKPRREGDVSALYADCSLATGLLGEMDYKSLDQICVDAWRWQKHNPSGYESNVR